MTTDAAPSGHFRKVRVPKISDAIADRIRGQILRGELAEGDMLPSEAELRTLFEVSRPTLREAMRILETESLITVCRGARGGARVRSPSTDLATHYVGLILQFRSTTLDDLYVARTIIEPSAVGLLAEQRSDNDIAVLRAALEVHDEQVDDPARSVRTHTAFHALLIELTGNQTLRLLTGMIEQVIDVANWSHVQADVGTPAHARASHRGLKAHHLIVDLIEEGDRAGATDLWHRHLDEARAYLLRADVETVVDLLRRPARPFWAAFGVQDQSTPADKYRIEGRR